MVDGVIMDMTSFWRDLGAGDLEVSPPKFWR